MAIGRIPYAGESYDTSRYEQLVWEMMREKSRSDERYNQMKLAQSSQVWDPFLDLPTQAIEGYRDLQDRKQLELDRERAEQDRQRGITREGTLDELAGFEREVKDAERRQRYLTNLPARHLEDMGYRTDTPLTPDQAGPPLPEGLQSFGFKSTDLSGNPIDFPLRSSEGLLNEKIQEARLLGDVELESNKALFDYESDRAEIVERQRLQDELILLHERFGLQLSNESQLADLDQIRWFDRTKQQQINDLIKAGRGHLYAVEQASRGSVRIPGGVQRTITDDDGNTRTVKVEANIANSDGSYIVPKDDSGNYYILESVDPKALGFGPEGRVVERTPEGVIQTIPNVYGKTPETEQPTGMFLSEEQKQELLDQSTLAQPRVDSEGRAWPEIMRKPSGFFETFGQTGPGAAQLQWIDQFLGTHGEGQRARERVHIAVIDLVKILEDQGRHSQSQRDWLQANMGIIEGAWDISKDTLYIRFQQLRELVDSIVRSNFLSLTGGDSVSETKDRQEWIRLKGASDRVMSAFGFPPLNPMAEFSDSAMRDMTIDPDQ